MCFLIDSLVLIKVICIHVIMYADYICEISLQYTMPLGEGLSIFKSKKSEKVHHLLNVDGNGWRKSCFMFR